ncbi:ribose ABC transporter permease protein [Halalkalibacter krulwichiae]|nr:ribose ABC transporter permease protein [Halalkalibacter krulwichiae]
MDSNNKSTSNSQQKPTNDTKIINLFQALLQNKVLFALLIICVILSFTSEQFLSFNNLTNILLQSAIMG